MLCASYKGLYADCALVIAVNASHIRELSLRPEIIVRRALQ
jgi:hypothetical protein